MSEDTYPVDCSDLYKKGCVMIEGRPCRIEQIETTDENVNIVALDLFTGKELKVTWATNQTVQVPEVNRENYTLKEIKGNNLTLNSDSNQIREDLKLPDGELGEEIKDAFAHEKDRIFITVLTACGESQVVNWKLENP